MSFVVAGKEEDEEEGAEGGAEGAEGKKKRKRKKKKAGGETFWIPSELSNYQWCTLWAFL